MSTMEARGAAVVGTATDMAPQPRLRAVALAYGLGLLVTLGLAHFLYDLPIQVTDSFSNMLKLGDPWGQLMASQARQEGFLRPLLWAALKAVYDLSGGNYYWWFRSVHVLQVLLLVVFYLQLVRPRTFVDALLVPLGLGMLVGLHTFLGTINEAFPINTFLTILLCCFGAALIALSPYRWWNDVIAALVFCGAALTVESGLLVWVIFAGAALVGARGVSRRGQLALAVLFVGYFGLRFLLLDVGVPGLEERSSGYGFSILEPDELIERFGDWPFGFYVYNVITSFVSVLVAEPRAGVFRLTSSLVSGTPDLALAISSAASLAATTAIALFAWRRRHALLARRFDRDDQLVLIFGMVLVANAVISYPYTKDVIMSPAGAFYAVAAYVAIRQLISMPPHRPRVLAPAATFALCTVLSIGWALRVGGTHLSLRQSAFDARNEWAYVTDWMDERGYTNDPRAAALARQLRQDAIVRYPAPPTIRVPYSQLFDLGR